MSDLIRVGDSVEVLNGRYKGHVMLVEKIAPNSMGELCLYLTMGNVVIFRTVRHVKLVQRTEK